MLDLSIIVVTYKEDIDVLRRCFTSIRDSQGLDFELIVIDNACRQETAALLRDSKAEAQYVTNTENKGFAAAVNQGMRLSQGRYILLLNPDTEFTTDVLKKMVAHLDADQQVGIASAIIRYPDGKLQESIRRFPTLWNQLIVLYKLPHLFPCLIKHYMMRDVDPLKTQDVESIMGAFMFIRRQLLETIGLFDERYFIWFEEVDYCKMAHDAGWKIRHYADVEITHHKGHSFSKLGTIRKQKWIRQSLRKYMKKHHGLLPWLVLWAKTPIFVLLAYLAALAKRG